MWQKGGKKPERIIPMPFVCHIGAVRYNHRKETMKGAAEAVWLFNKGIVDAVCDLVPAVKPQIAMYEQFGVEGVHAFQKTVSYCKEKGLVVIGDIKRGDIGSTSEAYAVGHFGAGAGRRDHVPRF